MTKILWILLIVFTVNFWSDNTETKLLSSQQVEEASDAVPPADPDSACHSFTGWDKSYDTVLEKLDIHATYTENQYTLNIDNEHMSSEHGSIRALSPYSFDTDGVMKDIPCGETYAVFEVDPATDITNANADINAYKRIENNHVVIIRNNEKYDVTGKKL